MGKKTNIIQLKLIEIQNFLLIMTIKKILLMQRKKKYLNLEI